MLKKLKNNKSEAKKRKEYHYTSERRKKEVYLKNEARARDSVKKNIVTKYEKIMMDILEKKGIEYKSQFIVHTPRSFYSIDIYIPRYRICIEIDGKIHETPEKKEADLRRDTFLRSRGFYVVRIANSEVRTKGWGKLWYLQKCLEEDYE